MSLLPGQILPPNVPFGLANKDGQVRIAHDWWLFLYNLAEEALGNGGLTITDLVALGDSDSDIADTDATSLSLPIGNLANLVNSDLVPTSADLPDIYRALLWAQDPALQDPSPQAQPSSAISPTGSPFSYTAPFNGSVIVSGGSVSAISIKRQTATIATGLTVGQFALSRLDQLIVTYGSAPTMAFLPT